MSSWILAVTMILLQIAYNNRTLIGDPFNFTVKEQFITPKEYNSLISDLNDLNICEYQFDLEPDYGLTDGPSFSLVAKQDTQLKALYWEDHPRNDDPETKRIFKWCERLLVRAGYMPKAVAFTRPYSEDSLRFGVSIVDFGLVDSVEYFVGDRRFERYDSFAIARSQLYDTLRYFRVLAYIDSIVLEPAIEVRNMGCYY